MVSSAGRGITALAVLVLFFGLPGCSLLPWHWGRHVEHGNACWYGPEYQGRQTASGELFNQEDLTAAHRSLPFGAIVRVKNLDNNRTVQVRINDRGPHKRGRIIDLSRAAARELGMITQGIVPVRIEVIHRGPGQ